ncbi:hypothetical protein ABIA00_006189 [Bradyrhizobium ottawaense]
MGQPGTRGKGGQRVMARLPPKLVAHGRDSASLVRREARSHVAASFTGQRGRGRDSVGYAFRRRVAPALLLPLRLRRRSSNARHSAALMLRLRRRMYFNSLGRHNDALRSVVGEGAFGQVSWDNSNILSASGQVSHCLDLRAVVPQGFPLCRRCDRLCRNNRNHSGLRCNAVVAVHTVEAPHVSKLDRLPDELWRGGIKVI